MSFLAPKTSPMLAITTSTTIRHQTTYSSPLITCTNRTSIKGRRKLDKFSDKNLPTDSSNPEELLSFSSFTLKFAQQKQSPGKLSQVKVGFLHLLLSPLVFEKPAFFHNFGQITLLQTRITALLSHTRSMASFLLPIIGSPPYSGSLSSSPSMTDDISALTGSSAFSADSFKDQDDAAAEAEARNILKNRRFTLRRKLSTSFDDPQTSMILGIVAQKAREGQGKDIVKSKSRDNNNALGMGVEIPGGVGGLGGGGAWLEEHYRKFNQLRISECSEGDGGDGDNWSLGSSGSSGSGGGGGGRIKQDIFQLLEKVIEFKSRNVSHITVEQCVKDLCTVYNDTDETDKLKFFNLLGSSYGVDHSSIVTLAKNLGNCQDEQTKLNLEEKLRSSLIPKYQWVFSQIGRLDNGVKFLVDLRTDVLEAIEKSTESTTLLKPLNNCLKELIGVWFAVGFLKLERVTWNSPCEMLQKISEYEAVHPMRNWTDLKKRVGPNRRCFVFTHGSMPSEPVVVLHTALTNHIPSSIHKIVTKKRLASLDTENDVTVAEEVEDHAYIDTAIFYSITSTQKGLTGIELGNYLIKRVVRELQIEFPKMHQFSSLSPIPGFSKWLLGSLKTAQRDPDNQQLLSSDEIRKLSAVFKSKYSDKEFFEAFLGCLKVNSWYSDNELSTLLEAPLMRLCSQYLYLVKRRGYALDPVAHFHLKNGAVMWRINWNGDVSPRGLTNSCGMMVNYRYFLDDCENNSQNYLEQQTVQISDQVRALVKQNELMFSSKM